MSLIVADLEPNGIAIVSDLRLTDHTSAGSPNPFTGALKLAVLHRRLVVAYAGAFTPGAEAVSALQHGVPVANDVDSVVRFLLREHQRCNRGVDFMVGSLTPSISITTVRDGRLDGPAGGRAWIGSATGFDRFQRSFAAQTADSSRAGVRGALMEAMRSVVEDGGVPSVGDAVIAAFADTEGFRYSCSIEAHGAGEQSIPPGVPTPIEFGQGAPAGSFTQSVLTPTTAGVGAIAIYIRELEMGALYWPAQSIEPLRLAARTQLAFSDLIRQQFGLALTAPDLR